MWRWHAIEEIEHKAVAYDTWVHATRALPRWRRWAMRSLAMAAASLRFHGVVVRNTADLRAQDGRNDWRSGRGLIDELNGGPGGRRRQIGGRCREEESRGGKERGRRGTSWGGREQE